MAVRTACGAAGGTGATAGQPGVDGNAGSDGMPSLPGARSIRTSTPGREGRRAVRRGLSELVPVRIRQDSGQVPGFSAVRCGYRHLTTFIPNAVTWRSWRPCPARPYTFIIPAG